MAHLESFLTPFLLVLCFIGVTHSDIPHWDKAPDSLDWYTHGGETLIDPWNYIQRLGLYKIILKQTEQCILNLGMRIDDDPLWGLPVQHGWQFDTLRLNNFNLTISDNCLNSKQTGDIFCISSISWWADMNYHLAVLPFLGMVNAGYFNASQYNLNILPPALTHSDLSESERKFCTSVKSCVDNHETSLQAWTEVFEAMKECDPAKKSKSEDPQWRPDSLDKIIHLVWRAHVSSLKYALPLFHDEAAFMPGPEQTFGYDWANVVDFIAATRFLTSREQTDLFQKALLPKRLLIEGDNVPNIPDFTPDENAALWAMSAIRYANEKSEGRLLSFWERAMCSKKGRENGRFILANIATNPWGSVVAFVKLLLNYVFTPCDPDWNN